MREVNNFPGLNNALEALKDKRNWDQEPLFFEAQKKVTAVVVEQFAANHDIPNGFKGPINGYKTVRRNGKEQYYYKGNKLTVGGKGFQHFGGFKLGETDIAVLKRQNTGPVLFSELKSEDLGPKSFNVDIPENLKEAKLIQGVWDKTGPVQLWFKKGEQVYATLVLDETHRKVVDAIKVEDPLKRGNLLLALALVAALGTAYAWRQGHLASAQIWLRQQIGRSR